MGRKKKRIGDIERQLAHSDCIMFYRETVQECLDKINELQKESERWKAMAQQVIPIVRGHVQHNVRMMHTVDIIELYEWLRQVKS